MSKKSSKSAKRSGLILLLAFVVFALMTAACFLPFADGLTWKGSISIGGLSSSGSAKGFDLIFGTKDSEGNLQNTNVTLVVAYFLGCAAALFALLALVLGGTKKGGKSYKAIAILGGLMGLASGVMFLLSKQILDVENASGTLFGITAKVEYSLGVGFLLPGIFGCVSGASAIGMIVASL